MAKRPPTLGEVMERFTPIPEGRGSGDQTEVILVFDQDTTLKRINDLVDDKLRHTHFTDDFPIGEDDVRFHQHRERGRLRPAIKVIVRKTELNKREINELKNLSREINDLDYVVYQGERL